MWACVRAFGKHMCTFSILMCWVAHYKSEIWRSVHLWTQAIRILNLNNENENSGHYRLTVCPTPGKQKWLKYIKSWKRVPSTWERCGKRKIVSRKWTKIIVKITALRQAWMTLCSLSTHMHVYHDSWMSYIIWLFFTVLNYFGLFEARPSFHNWSTTILLANAKSPVLI